MRTRRRIDDFFNWVSDAERLKDPTIAPPAEIDALFGEGYEPSTGTVYPAVRALAEEGLVTSKEEGRKAV